MPWTKEQRSRLISVVKEYEILWRSSQNGRHHQHEIRAALELVHQQFESDGFTFNEVKQQWRNLKDIFYKRYEVFIKRAKNGEDPLRVKPCWAHFDELKFLLTNQKWVDPESGGRHRRCLKYNTSSIDFIDYTNKNEEENNSEEYLNNNDELNNLEIKKELNEEDCSNLFNLSSSNNLEDDDDYTTIINNTSSNNMNDEFNNIINNNIIDKQQNNDEHLLNKKRKINNLNNKEDENDRFKYFGIFVESAVRDLHQESPELARRLMQTIYSNISTHQMEAIN